MIELVVRGQRAIGGALALMMTMTSPPAFAGDELMPWLAALGPEGALVEIEAISAEASVTVSDGTAYDVAIRYRDPQIAIFHSNYPDRRTTLGIDGRYVWAFDGDRQAEVQEGLADFVLGHQMQAQILYFDRINPGPTRSEPVAYKGCDCMAYSRGEGAATMTMIYDRQSLMPIAMRFSPPGRDYVIMEYDDWREVGGVRLPYAVDIDDGQRQFEYRFSAVRANARDFEALRTPGAVLTDEQRLLRLHRQVMEAHLDEDISLSDGLWGAQVIEVGRGDVVERSGTDAQARLGASLGRRDHSRYDDLIRPIVRLADDGTLGWVIVQVGAEGVALESAGATLDPPEPFSWVAVWIELYEKVDGAWRLTGTVSNSRPQ